MDTLLGIAIIGSGSIAKVHAEAIALIPGTKLVAVCGRNAEASRAMAEEYGAVAVPTLEELALRADVDVVLVATPSGAHLDSALPLLKAGKHVLCEKPLEISTTRTARMIEVARERGVLLGGFFPLRCGAGARAIQEAVGEGRFGRLVFLSARIKWWRQSEYYTGSSWRGTWQLDGGGALINQGIHAVDLLQWLGGRPEEISAYSGRLVHEGIEVEDTLSATLRFSNGAMGTIEASTACYPGLDFSLEISGEKGTAVLVNDKIELWKFTDEREMDETIRQRGGQIRGGSSDPKAISCEGHRQQIEAFCQSIREGKDCSLNGTEASVAVAIVETAYKSVKSRKSEPITYLT